MRVDEWNAANDVVNEMITNFNTAIGHSNKSRWLDAAPWYAKSYNAGKTAEDKY